MKLYIIIIISGFYCYVNVFRLGWNVGEFRFLFCSYCDIVVLLYCIVVDGLAVVAVAALVDTVKRL